MLIGLGENQFVEVLKLEDMDDSLFSDYQQYDFFQLIWFTEVSGNTAYFLDFNEYTLKNDQIVLVYPGQIDKLDLRGKKGFLFVIRNETLFNINMRMNSDYLNGYYSNVFVTPDKETKDILFRLTDLMLTEYNSKNRILLMETYMEAFLFHVSSLIENLEDPSGKKDLLIPALMRLIDKHFIRQRETDFYAERLGLSIKKLNDITAKGTGKTVKQHLQERLILEMKKEIRLREKSLKEIAFDLGFNEPAYFTRFFKQHTTLTPTEFRDL